MMGISTKAFSLRALVGVAFLFLSAVGRAEVDTKEEQRAALSSIMAELRTHYGMAKFKKEHFGIDLDGIERKYIKLINTATTLEEHEGFWKKTKRDVLPAEEFRQLMVGLAAELRDGHTVILRQDNRHWTIGIETAAIDGKLYVTGFDPDFYLDNRSRHAVKIGDRIVEVDGRPVSEIARENMLYSQLGTHASREAIALERILNVPGASMRPKQTGAPVSVAFECVDENGDLLRFEASYHWLNRNDLRTLSALLQNNYSERIGNPDHPYAYGTYETRSYFSEGLAKTGMQPGVVSDVGELIRLEMFREMLAQEQGQTAERNAAGRNALAQYALQKDKKPADRLRAYTVVYKGRTYGVIRIPDYMPDDIAELNMEIQFLARAVQRFENSTHGLIIDQLTNGGGYISHATSILSLFAKDGKLGGQTIDMKLSKTLLDDFQAHAEAVKSKGEENFASLWLNKLWREKLERRYAAGDKWSGPMPYFTNGDAYSEGVLGSIIASKSATQYTKPILLLNDGRSGSSGDFVPSILQANGRAIIMGEPSMGLGGPVYRMQDSMPGSELRMRCTYGVCYRSDGLPVENLGVLPDIYRRITPEDLVDGFENYTRDVFEAMHLLLSGAELDEIQAVVRPPYADPDEMEWSILSERFEDLQKRLKKAKGLPAELKAYLDYYRKLTSAVKSWTQQRRSEIVLPLPMALLAKDVFLSAAVSSRGVLERLEQMIELETDAKLRKLYIEFWGALRDFGEFRVEPVRCSDLLKRK